MIALLYPMVYCLWPEFTFGLVNCGRVCEVHFTNLWKLYTNKKEAEVYRPTSLPMGGRKPLAFSLAFLIALAGKNYIHSINCHKIYLYMQLAPYIDAIWHMLEWSI